MSDTGFTISWTPSTGSTGMVIYEIQLWAGSRGLRFSTVQTTYRITDISPGLDWKLSIRADDGAGGQSRMVDGPTVRLLQPETGNVISVEAAMAAIEAEAARNKAIGEQLGQAKASKARSNIRSILMSIIKVVMAHLGAGAVGELVDRLMSSKFWKDLWS